ncbi:MAG: ABC transporter ATP-binding protein, partial [Leptolyngbya sp. SIO1D8]|nr:ABC transporter ATP-binding protein [Leptolyngbya sp. SIO1D8]
KSTLLKTISRIIGPLSGDIYVEGIPLQRFSQKALAKKVSLVLTGNQKPGILKVHELVALGRYPYTGWGGGLSREDHEKIDRALDLTNINHLAEENVATLSDGQMQKVMIARALAQDSDIMILDEPTAFLDVNNRLEIMHLLKMLAWETKKAILVSTHDLDSAFHTADKLWLATCCLPITTGCPEDLVLQGEIANLFDHEAFTFDLWSGRFKANFKSVRQISLRGEDKYYVCTKNGLERIGYKVTNEDSPLKLSIKSDPKTPLWRLEFREGQRDFNSIEELIMFLRAHHPA